MTIHIPHFLLPEDGQKQRRPDGFCCQYHHSEDRILTLCAEVCELVNRADVLRANMELRYWTGVCTGCRRRLVKNFGLLGLTTRPHISNESTEAEMRRCRPAAEWEGRTASSAYCSSVMCSVRVRVFACSLRRYRTLPQAGDDSYLSTGNPISSVDNIV